jgi:hypothetical protein
MGHVAPINFNDVWSREVKEFLAPPFKVMSPEERQILREYMRRPSARSTRRPWRGSALLTQSSSRRSLTSTSTWLQSALQPTELRLLSPVLRHQPVLQHLPLLQPFRLSREARRWTPTFVSRLSTGQRAIGGRRVLGLRLGVYVEEVPSVIVPYVG